jgi:uncharacterized protein (TIRG00374 family)
MENERQLGLPGIRTRRRRLRLAGRSLLLLLVVGAATYVLLPQLASIQRSFEVLGSLSVPALLLAAIVQCCCYLAHAYAFGAILALYRQRLPLTRRLALAMAPYSLSLVGGGQLTSSTVLYRWLRRSGVTAEAAVMTSVLPAFVNLVSFLGAATFGVAYLLSRRQLSDTLLLALAVPAVVAAAVVVTAWWLLRHRPVVLWFAQRLSRLWSTVRQRPHRPGVTTAVVDRLFSASKPLLTRGMAPVLAADALSVVFDALTLWFAFWAAGVALSPGIMLAGYAVPNLAGKLSVLPGGVGVVEASMAALYAALGVSGGIVVVAVLAYRMFSFWLPVALGFPLAAWLDSNPAPVEKGHGPAFA